MTYTIKKYDRVIIQTPNLEAAKAALRLLCGERSEAYLDFVENNNYIYQVSETF